MKKLFSLTVILVLLFAMPVYATESEDEESVSTTTTTNLSVKMSSEVTIKVLSGYVDNLYVDDVQISRHVSTKENKYVFKAPYGNHKLSITHHGDFDYDVNMRVLDINPYIPYKSITIVDGYVMTVEVKNQNGPLFFDTTDKSIACIDQSGNLVTLGPGEAEIIVYCGSKELRCPITVLPNKFSADKLTLDKCSANTTATKIHKVSYDSSGNIIVTYRICNNTGYNLTGQKLKVNLQFNDGTVLSKDFGKVKRSLRKRSYSDYKVKIPKSDLTAEVYDLYHCKPTVKVSYSYDF